MKIALTGATGNMGRATLTEILKISSVELVRLLVLPNDKRIKSILKEHKRFKNKIQVVFGNLADESACEQLVFGVEYVLNLAAVIPPHSDKHPEQAVECNQLGVKALIGTIEKLENQPKLIHISTVALYGNRNQLHPWAQVGDPLLVSPFDIYSATKLRGEFAVLESNLKNWAVLRQTAMLHPNMLSDNMSDGLMFHTCYNAPLEWVTAHDSGVLLANILRAEEEGRLGNNFWKKVFNIGGGSANCITGYDSLNDGFKIIGGSAKDFFKPYYNATRNFHGVWFYDGEKLNDLFGYQNEDLKCYWSQIAKKYWYFKLGKIVPKAVIGKFAIKRLFKDDNSPAYWYKHNDEAKLLAYFGGKENYEKLLAEKWADFNLVAENKSFDGEPLDYNKLKVKESANRLDYFFDWDKADGQIDIADLQSVAQAHGGKLLTEEFKTGDMYAKLEWINQDNQVFIATAYTVLRAGHWVNQTYTDNVWEFDRLSQKDKLYAQLWYDSHEKQENNYYCLDKNFNAETRG